MRELLRRAWYLVRRRRLDADLAEEMAFHRAMKERELVERGADPREAVRGARRAFGSLALAHNQARDVWMWVWLQDIAQDLRVGCRLLLKDRAFTVVAVLALGLGVGVNTTQFAIVYATCIRGLPIDRADRVLYVSTRDAGNRELGLSYRDFEETRQKTRVFAGLAAFAVTPLAVSDEGRAPERVLGAHISANAFQLLGEHPALGHAFRTDDDRPGAPPTAILGSGVWQSRYGSDPSIVGRTIRVDGTPTTVVGVMRDGFRFPTTVDLWRPLAQMPGLATDNRDARSLSVMGRMADGVTTAAVQAELSTTAEGLAHDYPATNSGVTLAAIPINERYSGRVTDRVWISFVTVGLVIVLIACANVANLLLMRSVSRSHEIALRASLGASRGRLVRQLLVEATVLAALGGVLGLLLSVWGVRLVTSAIPENTLPYWLTYTVDGRVFAALAAVCLGTVFVFALIPALRISRTNMNDLVKEGGTKGTAAMRSRHWMNVFLTAEFALTIMLLASTIAGVRLSRAAEQADLVINPSGLITAWVTLPADRYRTPDQRLEFYRQLAERLGAAGVSSATVASALPFGGGSTLQLAIDGRSTVEGAPPPTVWTVTVGAQYHQTMRLPVVRGRAFTERDGTAGESSAMVNQRFVDLYFPDGDPIGQRIRLTAQNARGPAAPWLTVVGVSPTVRQRLLPEPDPVVYLPLPAAPLPTAVLIARGPVDSAAVAPVLREIVRTIDRDLPLYRLMPMEEALSGSQWNGRLSSMMINVIACIALGLAAIGLYAVSNYGVAQRTREIGIRMALGSQPRQVAWLVLRRALTQLGVGLLAGVGCTALWGRLFLGEATSPDAYTLTDPWTLIVVSATIAAVAAVACLAPVRRATRLDPIAVLRRE
jgi:predicted permease